MPVPAGTGVPPPGCGVVVVRGVPSSCPWWTTQGEAAWGRGQAHVAPGQERAHAGDLDVVDVPAVRREARRSAAKGGSARARWPAPAAAGSAKCLPGPGRVPVPLYEATAVQAKPPFVRVLTRSEVVAGLEVVRVPEADRHAGEAGQVQDSDVRDTSRIVRVRAAGCCRSTSGCCWWDDSAVMAHGAACGPADVARLHPVLESARKCGRQAQILHDDLRGEATTPATCRRCMAGRLGRDLVRPGRDAEAVEAGSCPSRPGTYPR